MSKTKIKGWIYRFLTRLYSIFHPIEKKVVFSSFGGKQYSDNPRSISEQLHELFPEFNIVWMLKDTQDSFGMIPEYVKKVKISRKSIIHERATAFCVVTNEDVKRDVYKRKGQMYIQTWHGDIGLKKVLYDLPEGLLSKDFEVCDNRVTDLCIAASDYGVNQYRTAFRYNGEILKVGMPRNDRLITQNKEHASVIKNAIGIPKEAKVLIYAPTFRDNLSQKQSVLIDLKSVVALLNREGEEWVCMIRAHSSSSGISFECDNKIFYNVSNYPDMADLLEISDMLITDYSSCAGDFIRKRKPTILAVFDKEDYLQNCRELPFDFREVGFITAENQVELERILSSYTLIDYEKNADIIIDYFNIVETGKAAQKICLRINERYEQLYKNHKL